MEVCGLYKPKFAEATAILKALAHAVDEGDWERLEHKVFQESISELEGLAKTMDDAGCRCLPHDLLDPSEVATALRRAIEQKQKGDAASNITSLALALLQDVNFNNENDHK